MTGISSTSSATAAYQASVANAPQNGIRQQFMQLQNALQSGNLSSAQAAYSTIQQSIQSGSGSQSLLAGNSQISSDFQALGQALQSGNLSAAQSALTTFQQEMQSLGGSRSGGSGAGGVHRHHGKHFNGAMAQQMSDLNSMANALQSGDTSSATSALNTLLSAIQSSSGSSSDPFTSSSSVSTDLQNLQSALQSGSLSTAQSTFSTLMQDLGSAVGTNGSSSSSPYSSYQQAPLIGNTVDTTA